MRLQRYKAVGRKEKYFFWARNLAEARGTFRQERDLTDEQLKEWTISPVTVEDLKMT